MKLKDLVKSNLLEIFILFIAITVGFWFRFKGLGKWPLAVDEYYVVKSVQNVLEYGLPQWANGGYYTRGLLYQYLIAPFMLAGIRSEFAARFIIVFFNLLAIPPLYILAKKISGKFLAATLVIIFCFSVWEIEFARFARMYVPFQTIFLWYILFLYKSMFEGSKNARTWMYAISFLSIFIYEGSIFLVALNFLPLIWDEKTKSFELTKLLKFKSIITPLIICLIIFTATYFSYSLDINGNPSDSFPPNYIPPQHSSTSRILIPVILISSLGKNILWILLFFIPVFIIIYTGYKIIRDSDLELNEKLSIVILLIISLLNLFGLLFISFLIFLLIDWIKVKKLKSKQYIQIGLVILLNLVFWFIYALTTNIWYQYFNGFEAKTLAAELKKIFLLLFNYPNNYFEFYRYFVTIPKLTVIILLSTGLTIYNILVTDISTNRRKRLIIVALLLLGLMSTMINTELSETRYTFFLFPVFLFVVLLAIETICSKLFMGNKRWFMRKSFYYNGFFILILIYLFLSEDFNVRHIKNIDSKEINFRTVYNSSMKRHYYPRWDVRSPADVVNREVKANDIVIIDELNIEYYLKKLDYVYIHQDHPRFLILSVDRGTKERWTNAKLVYTNLDLLRLISKTKGNIWLISTGKPKLNELLSDSTFRKYKYYTSIDKSVILFRIPGGTINVFSSN